MAAAGTPIKSKGIELDSTKRFAYVAVDSKGVRSKGVMEASNESAVVRALSDQGQIPILVKNQRGGLSFDTNNLGGSRPAKMKIGELSNFARTFHQLLKAGISVQRALSSLSEDEGAARAAVYNDIADKVGQGVPLSEAMGEYPKCFDDVFCAYIQAGERSGTLVETTDRLADMLGKRAELKQKIKQVTAYPKMVAGAILLLTTGIMILLVPKYEGIYEQFDAKLPGPTLFLVSVANNFPIILAIFFAVVISITLTYKRAIVTRVEWGAKIDRVRFKMPVFGKLIHYQTLYRWTTTLSGAMAAGVPLGACLELASRASGSYWQRMILPRMQETLRTGRQLSEEVGAEDLRNLFPTSVRTMLSSGEATGEIAEMLTSVSESIDDEIDTIVAGLSAKMEVALLLVLGVVVGGLLAVLYLPILNLAGTVGESLKGTTPAPPPP